LKRVKPTPYVTLDSMMGSAAPASRYSSLVMRKTRPSDSVMTESERSMSFGLGESDIRNAGAPLKVVASSVTSSSQSSCWYFHELPGTSG
jgi:hypothetical protein